MILYPAIDLKDGKCIRLKKGELKQITFYNNNPIEQAKYFQEMGAIWIHMVDIDGAFKGKNSNHEIFINVKNNLNCSLQVGGGIRNIQTIEHLFENGIDRVVLGTLALKKPKLVKKVCKMFPNKIAVGVDVKKGFVTSEGWTKTSRVTTKEIVKIYEDAGVSVIIFTDIEKDGVLEGVNTEELCKLLNLTSMKVIASGGVSNLGDLEKLKKINSQNLDGVIVGRAIYEKKILVNEAIKILES
ncbi:MAG: 1-(5-phosphoribosyl)-5-[(5-phosphoribosylamino)methylideneamino]imidazole-4-carboxamide isomerase [Rickettsiales bacterium]|nr:1-(5-phosphoribosyl)-5-[(5-phosphoribosylamino)methylideneamino]imidazole-4-carboxamide isomerase [Rickettsiales bacterium]|tara:strand:+ start:1142 stop:1867 length:726 start_codon:yes stop_codon:yes gene_type:complete